MRFILGMFRAHLIQHLIFMPTKSTISALLSSLNKSHLTHSDISPLIEMLKHEPQVNVQLIGHSFEQRPIHLLTLGDGPIVIFGWTQMHGNEATATAAVFDLIDELLNSPEQGLQNWTAHFTLHILPMLNPDGAQRCIRQNAQAIDINRDANELQSPEGKLLMEMAKQLAPDIGFNLHDQSPYYQCGTSGNPATIAFLAPAFDYEKTINPSRERAMKIITHMTKALQAHIPNAIARYNDTYSARSFGDNIAGLGVSTILIEAGAAVNDPDRQIARKMNVLAIKQAMLYLLDEEALCKAKANSIDNYFAIPENIAETLSSLVIRNLSFATDIQHSYTTGVSIKQTARYSQVFVIDYIGDLGIQAGLNEYDANGLCYKQGKTFNVTENTQLTNHDYIALLKQGYLYIDDPDQLLVNLSDYDLCYQQLALGNHNAFVLQQPAFCLFTKADNKPSEEANPIIAGAMLNGQLLWFTH